MLHVHQLLADDVEILLEELILVGQLCEQVLLLKVFALPVHNLLFKFLDDLLVFRFSELRVLHLYLQVADRQLHVLNLNLFLLHGVLVRLKLVEVLCVLVSRRVD